MLMGLSKNNENSVVQDLIVQMLQTAGGLFVGTNAERLAEYKRFAETGRLLSQQNVNS